MPRSSAAAMSIEALRGAVEAMSLSCGRRSMISRGSGVRSRITQITSNGISLSITASGSATWSLNTVISARLATEDQSAILSATF
jgi:hypothetical protein